MFCVKAELKPSSIHGIGVFAKENIKKDTIIWKFQKNFDVKVSIDELQNLSDGQKYHILKFFWKRENYIYTSCDISNYMNHSDEPNTEVKNLEKKDIEVIMLALKDIQKNEELTLDYFTMGGYDIKISDSPFLNEEHIDPEHYNFLYD